MANDITLSPSFTSDNEQFEEYIEDIEINFQTSKDYFIGTFNTWSITINLNRSNVEVPEKIKLNLGINNIFYKQPTFTLTPTVDEETEEYIEVKGYDNSVLFDKDFEWTQTLPCTAGELAQGICNKLGVELESSSFINSDFIIYRQMVDDKRTYREVIAFIAGLASGNAFINENDRLEIRSFIETDIEVQEFFTSEKFVKVGPITGVNLAREPIKDYVQLNDNTLSAKYGSCMVKIVNNLIVDDNRELAIEKIYNQLRGLEFYCKKIETHEAYKIKPFSFVNCNDHKVLVDTICIKYPSLVDSYISSNQLSKVESELNIDRGLKKRIVNAEAKVDEVEGKINLLTSEVSEYENKLSEIELNVDSINQKVENTIDATRISAGANKIVLEECMQGEVLELHIYGNNTVFSNLFPYKKLYPSDNLFPFGDSLIKVFNDNLIPTIEDGYEQGFLNPINDKLIESDYNIVTKNFIEFESKGFYLKTTNTNYCISIIYFFDENYKIIDYKYYNSSDIEVTAETEQTYRIKVAFYYSEDETSEVAITPKNVLEMQPVLSISNINQFIENNTQIIDLHISEVLRQYENVCDEYVLKDNKAQIIRRIGVDENDNKYILENETIEDLGELIINLTEGTNYIEIVNYVANISAKYIILNNFTSQFATEINLKTSLSLLSNQMLLSVKQELGSLGEEYLERKKIESSIDLGILDDEGYMAFKTNKLTIDSDYFKLTKEGKIIATAGTIGKWTLTESGILYSNTALGTVTYQSGLDGRDNNYLLYAGIDITDGASHSLSEANAYITKSGLIYARWFKVNGESGYFYIDYDSGRTALRFDLDGIRWRLDDTNNNNFAMLWKSSEGMYFELYDAPKFTFRDAIHNYDTILHIVKYDPDSSSYHQNVGNSIILNSDIRVAGNRYDNVNYSMYVQGYEVQTNASDKRLKKNIKLSTDNATKKINRIPINEFDWRKEKHLSKSGQHVNNGFVAQFVKKIDNTLVNYNEEEDTYSMNVLNLIGLSYKAIQEISYEIKKIKKNIYKLEKMYKGDNNE